MCSFKTACSKKIYSVECFECCFEIAQNIDSFKSNKHIYTSWCWLATLFKDKTNTDISDNRPKILLLYIFVPSLFRESIKELFLLYFEKNNIKREILQKGKWMSSNINVKKNLLESLFVTQKIQLGDYEKIYYDAMEFFTSDKNELHRDKVAHATYEILGYANAISLDNMIKQITILLHLLVYFSEYIKSFPQNATNEVE